MRCIKVFQRIKVFQKYSKIKFIYEKIKIEILK
jgi:hypothetical protein